MSYIPSCCDNITNFYHSKICYIIAYHCNERKKQSSKIDPCLSIVSRGRSCKCREHHIYNNSPNINGHCTNKRINKTGIFLFDNTRTRLYKNTFYTKLLNLVFLLLWLFSNFDLSVTAMTLLNETRV